MCIRDSHRVVLASVADPVVPALAAARASPDQGYAAAAAERTLALRERTAGMLQRLGGDAIDAPPQQRPPKLADHYLMLEAKGLL